MKIKVELATEIAKRLQDYYHFRYEKCLDLAMQASWWTAINDIELLKGLKPEDLVKQVIDEYQNGLIE